AAVVARGMGKACICGCEAIKMDANANQFTVGETVVQLGDTITIDGATGDVILGEVPMIDPDFSDEFQRMLAWTEEVSEINVLDNEDDPKDATKGLEFGAVGIGLCRTEHLFMDQERIPTVQQMILAESFDERKAALDQLLPMQQEDFEGVFEVMQG